MLETYGKESGMTSTQLTNSKTLKIAVVGDVHDQWENEDGIAL
ncbi:MAG: TIGR04168 family protein, partial [Rivularia sp. (in: cyanobacteria)]